MGSCKFSKQENIKFNIKLKRLNKQNNIFEEINSTIH